MTHYTTYSRLRLAARNNTPSVFGHQADEVPRYATELLLISVEHGHQENVVSLRELGANILANDNEPLRLAAAHGWFNIVRQLHENGANIRVRNDECVRVAATGDHVDVVRQLRENGADLCSGANHCIRTAAANGNLEFVKYIVSEVGSVGRGKFPDDATPLYEAAVGGHDSIVTYLLELGERPGLADFIHVCGRGHLSIAKMLWPFVSERLDESLYPVAPSIHSKEYRAFERGRVGRMLQHGQDSLARAAWLADFNGHREVVEFLRGRGVVSVGAGI